MATINLSTVKELEDTLAKNSIVIIDFWASWCGPCKAFGPVFEKVSEAQPAIVFAKCNTEEAPELAGSFDVSSIPTLAIFRDTILLYKEPGALPQKPLEDLIRQVNELDMNKVREQIAKE